ncbi:hypothetical protein VQ056_10610 [Paenibacillus sp. JTLBN-2024]
MKVMDFACHMQQFLVKFHLRGQVGFGGDRSDNPAIQHHGGRVNENEHVRPGPMEFFLDRFAGLQRFQRLQPINGKKIRSGFADDFVFLYGENMLRTGRPAGHAAFIVNERDGDVRVKRFKVVEK